MKNIAETFKRLESLKNRVKIDSFTVAGVRFTFPKSDDGESHYSEIIHRLEKFNTPKTEDVFVISAHNVDEINKIDEIKSDHECEVQRVVSREPGGSGANSASLLSLLGLSVSVTGAVADDDHGVFLESNLKKAGVKTDLLYIDKGSLSGKTTTIIEDGGKRLIVVSPGSNSNFHQLADFDSIVERARRSKIVHLSSFVGKGELRLQEKVAKELNGNSLISLTPGALYSRNGLDRITSLLENVDIMFLYTEQLMELVKRSSAKSSLQGDEPDDYIAALFKWRGKKRHTKPMIVVVKDIFDGEMKHTTQRFLSVGVGVDSLDVYMHPEDLPPQVELEMSDTTGAGDAAVAGFLAGVLNQAPLSSSIDSAFLMSSYASSQYGARTAFFLERKNDIEEISKTSQLEHSS